MSTDYKSGEQRFIDWVRGPVRERVSESARGLVAGAYGAAMMPLRIPTFVRRYDEKHSLPQRAGSPGDGSPFADGVAIGGLYSALGWAGANTWAAVELARGDWEPVAALCTFTAMTNMVSLCHELNRAINNRSTSLSTK